MILRQSFLHKVQLLFYSSWFILISFVSIVPPLVKSGFPLNHEDDAFVLRTVVYAKHFRFGDLVPVWAASELLLVPRPTGDAKLSPPLWLFAQSVRRISASRRLVTDA